MSEHPQQEVIPNQSNLLENNLPSQHQPLLPATSSNSFDDIPIASKANKFQFSEYPEENSVQPAIKKAVVKKAVKKAANVVKEEVKENVLFENIKNDQNVNKIPLEEIPLQVNNSASVFDEKPIGKTQFNISQFPDGNQPEVVNVEYTMLQKIKSKAPKLRLSGMQDLLALLQQDPDHSDISQISMVNLLKETAPANIEKILQCFKVWMEKGKNWGEDQAKNAMESGYINGKPNTKKITIEIMDQMYEEKSAIVQMVILLGFKNKIPKNIAGYIAIVNELLTIYGIKKMKYLKPYFPEIIRVMTAQKLIAVKNQGMVVLKQSYKWLGKEVVEPMIIALKEGFKKELDTFWETYDKTIVMSAPKDIAEEQGNGKNKGKKVDAYDLSQAVDIFKKFNQKWAESVLKAQKWNEKTKMMEQFVKCATIPKIANADYRHVTQVIRRLINDSNFNVVLWDLRMLGVLSKGLRRPFFPVVKNLFSNVLSKFRDKKTQMIDETFNTLNDFMYSISLEDVIDDVKEGLNDKAPNMKVNLLNWIGKFVESKSEEKGDIPEKAKEAIKSLFPIFEKLLADGVLDVRQCMAKNIGKMKLALGQEFFYALQSKMNKNLASKIKVDAPESSKKKEDSVRKNEVKPEELGKSSVSLKGPAKKVEQSKLGKTQVLPQKKEQAQQLKLECFDELSYEDSLTKLLGEGFPEEEVKKILMPGAKERTDILNIMKENPYENFNCVILVLKKTFKDWKEVNLAMNKELISFLESRCEDINKQQAYTIIPFIVQKIGDGKFAESLFKIVISMCTRIPGKFIIGHIIKYVRSTEGKKPKLNSDACSLIAKIIEVISVANTPLKQAIQFGKQNYNVQFSRKGAIQLFLMIYSFIGDQLKVQLDENTFKSIEPELKQVKLLNQEQKKSKLAFEGEAATENKNKKTSNVVQSKFKVDITSQIQRLMPKMNDNANWQNRKESAQAIINIFNQNNGRVVINCLHEFIGALKLRINDSNKQLIKTFVNLIGHVFAAIPEKDLKLYARPFICSLTQALSDKNQANKKEIHLTLNKIGQIIGKEQLITSIAPYLENEKDFRLQILNLILSNEEYLAKTDVRDFPKGICICIGDKNKDIRAQSEKLFEKVYEKLGMEVFRNIAKDMKPVNAKDLNTFLDKFDKNNMSMSSFNSKGPSPSKLIEKQKRSSQGQPPLSVSAKKRSHSRNNTQKSFIEQEEEIQSNTAVNFGTLKAKTLVQGDQCLAPIKVLASQRVQRLESDEHLPWKYDQILDIQEEELKDQISMLFRQDLAKRMLSFEHKRVLDSVIQIIKICKDLTYQGHIRQIYDIILKWVLLRMWGGNPSILGIIEVIPPVLCILEKKKVSLNDNQVDLVVCIIREYFISAYMNQYKVSQSLYAIIKCLTALSSGEKVLKKIFRQFSIELTSIHRHIKKEACTYYRDGLSKLVKTQLMEYVGNEDTLEEASKIKQLKNDEEFVEMLFRRFHQNVLSVFGFKKIVNTVNQSQVNQNNSSMIQKDKSTEKMPTRNNGMTSTMGDLGKIANNQINQNPPIKKPPISNHLPQKSETINPRISELNKPEVQKHQQDGFVESTAKSKKTFDLSIYPAPNPSSPLGKQLGKLYPPNESSVSFFTSLFSQSGQKIANELISHSKIIFISILKSVQDVLSNRKQFSPDKIVNQINLLQSCIKCKSIVKNIGELLYHGTNFALTQLVYEDQNKILIQEDLRDRNIDYKIQNFIKVINGVMLRILENGTPSEVVNILLDLLITQTRQNNSSAKTVSLIVKCMSRVATNFTNELKIQSIKDFFIKANEYLGVINFNQALEELQVHQNQRPKPQDSVVNIIKGVIVELCKSLSSEVWDYYEDSMKYAKYPDQHISTYISALNIRYPERNKQSNSQQKENEELKKINQLLSKNKSFDSGIIQLKKYISQHSTFDPIAYFTSLNYDQKFIAMVVNTLSGNPLRRTPKKQNSREEKSQTKENPSQNIQDKIKKLKQKFQQLQPETSGQSNPISSQQRVSSANRGNLNSSNQEQDHKEERAQEIRRRIDEMKNKMHSAVNRGGNNR